MAKYKIFKKQNNSVFEFFEIPNLPTSYYSFVSEKVKEGFNQYTFTVNKFLQLLNVMTEKDYKVTYIDLLETDTEFENEINDLVLKQEIVSLREKIEFLDHYEEVDLKSISFTYHSENSNQDFNFKIQNNGVIIVHGDDIDINRRLFKLIEESVLHYGE